VSSPFLFGADELGGADARRLAGALEAARALAHVADDAPATDGPAFSDRVMAALANEPSPATGGFLLPLRRNGIVRGFAESLRQAWASSGRGRPALARAMALAYVLIVAAAGVSLAGAATFGAAGALGVFAPQATHEPSPEPITAPVIEPPEATDESSAEPSEDVEETEAPEASPDESESPDDRDDGAEPDASDDHGGNSVPGGGGDDKAGPGETGSPDASDDHGGSDGGSGPSGTDDHSGSDEGGSSGGSND
jgi:hypothetical protein